MFTLKRSGSSLHFLNGFQFLRLVFAEERLYRALHHHPVRRIRTRCRLLIPFRLHFVGSEAERGHSRGSDWCDQAGTADAITATGHKE